MTYPTLIKTERIDDDGLLNVYEIDVCLRNLILCGLFDNTEYITINDEEVTNNNIQQYINNIEMDAPYKAEMTFGYATNTGMFEEGNEYDELSNFIFKEDFELSSTSVKVKIGDYEIHYATTFYDWDADETFNPPFGLIKSFYQSTLGENKFV